MTFDRELARHQSNLVTYALQRVGQAIAAGVVAAIACLVGFATFDENGVGVGLVAAPLMMAFVLLTSSAPDARTPLPKMSDEDERRLSGDLTDS